MRTPRRKRLTQTRTARSPRQSPTGRYIVHAVIAAWVLAPSLRAAGDVPALVDPHIPHGERTVYRLTGRDGATAKSIHSVTVESTADGDVYVVATETKRMLLRRADLTPIEIEYLGRDRKVVWRIRYEPDRAVFIYPGPERNKVVKADRNRYDVNAITHVVRGFPFGRARKVRVDLVVPGRSVGAYFKLLREEPATVPAGTFDCAVLEAGLTGIKGRLYRKKARFWVALEAPHRLIRQEDEGITDIATTELVESTIVPPEEAH